MIFSYSVWCENQRGNFHRILLKNLKLQLVFSLFPHLRPLVSSVSRPGFACHVLLSVVLGKDYPPGVPRKHIPPNGKRKNIWVFPKIGDFKSSILIGFSLINHPFWGTPIFGNTHLEKCLETGDVSSLEDKLNYNWQSSMMVFCSVIDGIILSHYGKKIKQK